MSDEELPTPALQRRAAGHSSASQRNAADFSPIENDNDPSEGGSTTPRSSSKRSASKRSTTASAASTAQQYAVGVGAFGGGGAGGVAIDVAQQEFERRWQRATDEEERLRLRAIHVERMERQLAMHASRREPNFPPCKPVVCHDIVGDIPVDRQRLIRIAYGNYFFTIFMLIANLVLVLVIATGDTSAAASDVTDEERSAFTRHVFLAFPFVLGSVFAFIVWYWPMYKACSTGSSGSYVVAFIGLFIGFAFALFCAVGPVGFGGCGFVFALEARKMRGTTWMYVATPAAVLWATECAVFFLLGVQLRGYYIEDAAALDEARRQMPNGAAGGTNQNQHPA